MSVAGNGRQWYTLFCVRGLGPKRLHTIHRALEDSQIAVDDLFRMDWSDFQRLVPGMGRPLFEAIQSDNIQTDVDYRQLIRKDISVVHLGHLYYPKILLQRMQDSAPPILFCQGYLELLKSDGVAIVGSRNASPTGLALAAQFAAELAREGKNVISGYAKGIDTQAHLGALGADGTTTIVLSSGIYDFSRKKEFEHVSWERNVLAVSQFHPGEKWSARNAMVRNKLVCALAQAVIVIEAGPEIDDRGRMSGTFEAGKTALQMGVPLFVVDPCTLDSYPPGNKELIERGGIEIKSPDAISTILKHIEPTIAPLTYSDYQPERAKQLTMF